MKKVYKKLFKEEFAPDPLTHYIEQVIAGLLPHIIVYARPGTGRLHQVNQVFQDLNKSYKYTKEAKSAQDIIKDLNDNRPVVVDESDTLLNTLKVQNGDTISSHGNQTRAEVKNLFDKHKKFIFITHLSKDRIPPEVLNRTIYLD